MAGDAVHKRELRPLARRRYVPAADVVAAFASSPPIDRALFRRDLDAVIQLDDFAGLAGLLDVRAIKASPR
jgi:hypothetical protein